MKLKKLFLKLVSILMLVSLIFLNSCSKDNPVTPTIIDVTGKIIDGSGRPIPGVRVAIEGSIQVSAADGSFTINGVTSPYDLKMVAGLGSLQHNYGWQYKALTTTTPLLLAVGLTTTSNSASLTVTIPAMIAGQECRVYFTDGANVQRASSPFSFPAVSTTFTVSWVGGSSITGKIIVLIDAISGGTITSYNKYGEKTNYTLNNGGVQTQTFLASDLSVIPGNATVTGSVTAPSGYTGIRSQLSLKFGNAGSSFTGSVLYEIIGNTFTYNVPTGLTTAPNFFVSASAVDAPGTITYKSITVSAGSSGNTVNLETVSTLSSPPDEATNIDTNTNFTFAQGSGTGINMLTFVGPMGPQSTFYVFTTAATAKMPNFSALGLGIGSMTLYHWDVIRFLGFNNVDSFVSSDINNNSNYNGQTFSATRSFTTAP